MDAPVTQSSSASFLTWTRLVALTLVAMIIGIAAGVVITGRVGLFASPLLPFTVPFYLLVWLPIFIIGLLFRPRGSRRALFALIGLGAVIGVVGLALLGPSLSYSVQDCESAPLADSPVRFECSYINYQNAISTFILEGTIGSPFVQVVEPVRPLTTGSDH